MGIKTVQKREELKREIKRNSSGTFTKLNTKTAATSASRVANKTTKQKVLSSTIKGVTQKNSISNLAGISRRQRSSRMTDNLDKVMSYEPVLKKDNTTEAQLSSRRMTNATARHTKLGSPMTMSRTVNHHSHANSIGRDYELD